MSNVYIIYTFRLKFINEHDKMLKKFKYHLFVFTSALKILILFIFTIKTSWKNQFVRQKGVFEQKYKTAEPSFVNICDVNYFNYYTLQLIL